MSGDIRRTEQKKVLHRFLGEKGKEISIEKKKTKRIPRSTISSEKKGKKGH